MLLLSTPSSEQQPNLSYFPTSYMAEAGPSHVNAILQKLRLKYCQPCTNNVDATRQAHPSR